MVNSTIPGEIRKLTDAFKNMFPVHAWMQMCSIFAYFLYGSKSFSNLARQATWSSSVSSLSSFVKDFDGPRWMRRHQKKVLRQLLKRGIPFDSNHFCFVVDDTNNPKFGNSYRCGSWYGSKGLYHGQRIVLLAIVELSSGLVLPLGYRFATKQDHKEYQPCFAFVHEIIDELIVSGFPKLPIVFDSWFDSVEFVASLEKKGFEVVWEIKSNRNIKTHAGNNAPWTKLILAFKFKKKSRLRHTLEAKAIKNKKKKGPCGVRRFIYIKERQKMINCVAIYNRRNGASAFAYWVTTNSRRDPASIWMLSRARWRIEYLFRELKQNLSFGRLPCASKEASDLSVVMPIILYTSLQLDQHIWGKREAMNIGGTVLGFRQELTLKSIQNIVRLPKNNPQVIRLTARLRKDRANKKPVNIPADLISEPQRHRKTRKIA